MGVAIRTRKPIAVSLAPFVWKLLLGCQVGEADLEDVDLNYAKVLQVRNQLIVLFLPGKTPVLLVL